MQITVKITGTIKSTNVEVDQGVKTHTVIRKAARILGDIRPDGENVILVRDLRGTNYSWKRRIYQEVDLEVTLEWR